MSHQIADDVRSEQRVWAKPDSLDFFQTHRNAPEDLYKSERFFLPDVLPKIGTVLDIGCAAGGFSRIMKSFNPGLEYTGMDITPEFVEIASRTYPDSRFVLGDGIHHATQPGTYDLVYSTGILHLNSRWKEIVRGAYGQASRFLLCDFRLTYGEDQEGTMRVDFDGKESDATLPYYVVNVGRLVDFLKSLEPTPASIHARGYYHAPSATASLSLERVLMAFFLVVKGSEDNLTTEVDLAIPGAEEENAK